MRTVVRSLALAPVLACAWLALASSAAAQDCPTASFVIYEHLAYVEEAVPGSVTLERGDQLGEAELDTAGDDDPCKRTRSSATAVRIGGVDPKVAIAVAGRPDVAFVVGAACSGYEGAERWRCLLEPLVFEGVSYTGVRYPGSDPEDAVPLGDALGDARLADEQVTAATIAGVDPRVAVGVEGRPGEVFVAPGVCPYERFAVEGAINDLMRCLRSPLWLVLDPPGGVTGTEVTAIGDREAVPELATATVALAPITVEGESVQADFAAAVEVGALGDGPGDRPQLEFAIPELEPGPYEAIITCEECAASFGGETIFPAGLFRVTAEAEAEESGGTSPFQIVGIVVGVLFLGLLVTSIVLWRKGFRVGRRRRGGTADTR